MKNFVSIIKNIGLTENEAEVYIAGLKNGACTVTELGRNLPIQRPNVYKVLESLADKNLLSIEYRGLKKYFRMSDPEDLLAIISNKRDELTKNLPELRQLFFRKLDFSEIKISYGLNSLKSTYSDLLSNHKPGQFYYVTSDLEKWKSIDNKFLSEFIENRIKKNISLKIISTESEAANYNRKFARNFLQEVKILPKNIVHNVDTIITPEKIVLISLDDKITIFEIRNQYFINYNKSNFETIWQLLP